MVGVQQRRNRRLATWTTRRFRNHFQDAFGWRLGRVQAVGRRSQWPLSRLSASEQFRAGFLLVGNAAHTLHPVAGQGLNLSLREAGLLAQAIADAQQRSAAIGCLASLKTYLDQVSDEQRLVVDSTDALATSSIAEDRYWMFLETHHSPC